MLKSIKDFLSKILNSIFPERPDFRKINSLSIEDINSLPKSGNLETFDWIFPLFQYKNETVRSIIWELKYKENTRPIEYIGKLMYESIIAQISDIVIFDNDAIFTIIPIPLYPLKKFERGFNQSELIAKSIIANDNERKLLYAPQWLEKIKDTPKQSRSDNKEERLQNLKGCFKANPKVNNYYVFLIDDVTTTRSTLSEARKTLFESGSKDVFGFTIAH